MRIKMRKQRQIKNMLFKGKTESRNSAVVLTCPWIHETRKSESDSRAPIISKWYRNNSKYRLCHLKMNSEIGLLTSSRSQLQ